MERSRRTLAVLLLLFFPSAVAAEMLRLRDGTLLFGEIVSHDEAGVRVKRLDNGGVVDLRWDRLAPQEATRLRSELGYLDQEGEEVRVLADRIRTNDGQEVVGILLDSRGDDFVLRVRETTIAVPKVRVVPPIEKVEVDALAVHTKDQLYNERLAAIDAKSAPDHLELARFLVRVKDFSRALEHFKKVRELDPNLSPGEVAAKVTRCENLAAHQVEVDRMAEIDFARARREYTKALDLCEKFARDFAGSPLLREVAEKRKRTETRRDEASRDEVVRRWYEFARRVAQEKTIDRSVTLEEAKTFAEQQMSKEILKLATAAAQKIDPALDEAAVRAMWDARGKRAKTQRASYGQGTFILGKQKALEGLEPEKEAESKPAEDPQKKELEEKIRRYMKALQGAKQSPADEEQAPQKWWDGAGGANRMFWLLAYYAEFGGDMKLGRPRADACRTCGGTGTIEVLPAGGSNAPGGGAQGGGRSGGGRGAQGNQPAGGKVRTLCPDCHGIQIYRTAVYS